MTTDSRLLTRVDVRKQQNTSICCEMKPPFEKKKNAVVVIFSVGCLFVLFFLADVASVLVAGCVRRRGMRVLGWPCPQLLICPGSVLGSTHVKRAKDSKNLLSSYQEESPNISPNTRL